MTPSLESSTLDAPAGDLDTRLRAIDDLMARAQVTMAYDQLAEAMGRSGDDPRVLRRMALVLARLHATRRANAILQRLYDNGMRDAETAGLLARTFKDLWIAGNRTARGAVHLRSAGRYYDQGFRFAMAAQDVDGAIYTGINAAAVALWQDRPKAARAKAREVLRLSHRRLEQGPDYWAAAAAAEATLIGGDVAGAATAYQSATALARDEVQWRASTRRNAHLLLRALGEAEHALDECFAIPAVVLAREGSRRTAPRGGIARRQPGPALAANLHQPASTEVRVASTEAFVLLGTDSELQVAEQLADAGAALTIVLPIPAPALEASRHGIWARRGSRDRARALLERAARVVIGHDRASTLTPTRLHYAERFLAGLAHLRAAALESAVVAVEPGRTGTLTLRSEGSRGPSGLRHDRGRSGKAGAIRRNLTRRRAAWADEIKALMFADVAGYSGLDESQVKAFVREFMGRVAKVVDRLPARPEVSHTWGDALYFVFPSMAAAGSCALALREALDPGTWKSGALPRTLGTRIALHAGPAFRYIDPVRRGLTFTGSHVSWAARIEPITPPGQVYASEPFAALSAAEGVTGFRCVYVGTMPLAKKYGVQPLYVLEEGGPEEAG